MIVTAAPILLNQAIEKLKNMRKKIITVADITWGY